MDYETAGCISLEEVEPTIVSLPGRTVKPPWDQNKLL